MNRHHCRGGLMRTAATSCGLKYHRHLSKTFLPPSAVRAMASATGTKAFQKKMPQHKPRKSFAKPGKQAAALLVTRLHGVPFDKFNE